MTRRKLTDYQRLMLEAERRQLEDTLAFNMRAVGVPEPEREYRFSAVRDWRFDFAWPAEKVALEVEGGTRSGGRHVRHEGYRADAIKYSYAALRGWCVVRVTADMISDNTALALIEMALGVRDVDDRLVMG